MRLPPKHSYSTFFLPELLRLKHCSFLFEVGASIKEVVQDRLGHSDVKTTLDIYTHVTTSQRRRYTEVCELFSRLYFQLSSD